MCLQRWEGLSALGLDGENKLPGTLCQGYTSKAEDVGDVGGRGWARCRSLPCGKSSHAQSCPTLCDPMDCSLPGSSVHGILQARILEWVATPSSRGSS